MKIQLWPLIISIFFAVVFSVNSAMLWLAASGYGGLLDQQPYEKGLAYDIEYAGQKAFKDQLWNLNFQTEPFSVTIIDRSGIFVTDAKVKVNLLRPNNPEKDLSLILRFDQNNRYISDQNVDLGRWIVKVLVERDGREYRFNRSIFVEDGRVLILEGA